MSIVPRKTVVLEVSDTSLRLLVASGRNIKRAASTRLEPGLVQNGAIMDQEAVAARIRQLLRESKVHARRVSLCISGLHSLTMVVHLPQLPERLVAEAVMREAGRTLPVPLEQLYLTWQAIATPDRRLQVFVVGVPRTTADAVLATTRRAGLTVRKMDIKPMALTRLAPRPTCVLLDVQPTEFDIIVMGDGIPHPIRTIPIPAEDLDTEGRLAIIRDDLIRTIDFYNSNHADNPLVADTPVHVTGSLAAEEEQLQALAREVGHPVLPLPPPLRGLAEGVGYFAGSMGMVIGQAGGRPAPASLVADMDALPEAFRPKTFSLARVVAVTGSVLLVLAIVIQATMIQQGAAAMAQESRRLETINRIVEHKRLEKLDLKRALVRVEATQEMLSSAITELNERRSSFNHDLAVASNALPEGVSVVGLSHDGEIISITIDTPLEGHALGYARTLVNSGMFEEVIVTRMSLQEDGQLRFVITIVTAD